MKSFTEEFQTKKVCLEQNISIGSIHASFHNFHNVCIYVKWPEKIVMFVVSELCDIAINDFGKMILIISVRTHIKCDLV